MYKKKGRHDRDGVCGSTEMLYSEELGLPQVITTALYRRIYGGSTYGAMIGKVYLLRRVGVGETVEYCYSTY